MQKRTERRLSEIGTESVEMAHWLALRARLVWDVPPMRVDYSGTV